MLLERTIATIIHDLQQCHTISDEELILLLNKDSDALFTAADSVRKKVYGNDVYIRGLIEFTNYCRNNCYYCGLRRGNDTVIRYRLSKEDIIACCTEGYELGFRTFVLQGGEDFHYTDHDMCDIISTIRTLFPDCAITLSIGERSRASYQAYFDAGATRYLLRHETATDAHYKALHPDDMSLENRKQCLYTLKEIGFQVGAGFMVGSPGQTIENILADLRFLQELKPDMVGIGPFIHHHATPFRDMPNGSVELTFRILAIVRLMLPHVLLPVTTALSTCFEHGHIKGLCAGCNVIMPNLSPKNVRKHYNLYDNKHSSGTEAAEHLARLKREVAQAGYQIVTARGDVIKE
ncbi:MAG: [FeFe] hydrogenase H-cluster radical SAM maturase HydE [Lachnospiraceae bacterium]|nr:[FeFe] hydrogenase H-cluster radical SAM maturase HydE [Lachnospiraceae bacterium]